MDENIFWFAKNREKGHDKRKVRDLHELYCEKTKDETRNRFENTSQYLSQAGDQLPDLNEKGSQSKPQRRVKAGCGDSVSRSGTRLTFAVAENFALTAEWSTYDVYFKYRKGNDPEWKGVLNDGHEHNVILSPRWKKKGFTGLPPPLILDEDWEKEYIDKGIAGEFQEHCNMYHERQPRMFILDGLTPTVIDQGLIKGQLMSFLSSHDGVRVRVAKEKPKDGDDNVDIKYDQPRQEPMTCLLACCMNFMRSGAMKDLWGSGHLIVMETMKKMMDKQWDALKLDNPGTSLGSLSQSHHEQFWQECFPMFYKGLIRNSLANNLGLDPSLRSNFITNIEKSLGMSILDVCALQFAAHLRNKRTPGPGPGRQPSERESTAWMEKLHPNESDLNAGHRYFYKTVLKVASEMASDGFKLVVNSYFRTYKCRILLVTVLLCLAYPIFIIRVFTPCHCGERTTLTHVTEKVYQDRSASQKVASDAQLPTLTDGAVKVYQDLLAAQEATSNAQMSAICRICATTKDGCPNEVLAIAQCTAATHATSVPDSAMV